MAGGLNLYQFNGNNPVAYTDPFGLCPYTGKKRTEDVGDCPKSTLGTAFRNLKRFGGADGAAAIHTIASKQVTINVQSAKQVHSACQDPKVSGCTIGHTIYMVPGNSTSMATRVTHEANHVDNTAPYPHQEVGSWNKALNVFDALHTQGYQSGFYQPYSNFRQSNPQAFDQAVCQVAGGPPC